MSLNLPLKWQVPALGFILAATCLPTAITLYRQSEAQMQQRTTIENQSATVAENERIALDRARRCLLINEQYPLVEGQNAWYDPTNRKHKRLLPAGTALCSAASGFTAEVDRFGTVKDIRQASIEQIRQVLKQRGLL